MAATTFDVVVAGGGVVGAGATYHVSQQNTFTGRLTEGMLDDVVALASASAP